MAAILLLNGPNLNLLGVREPELYGSKTLKSVNDTMVALAQSRGHKLFHMQTNAEHELIDRVHLARVENVDFIIINPAALTHSSIALRDSLLAVSIPFIEVHVSNVYKRERFRRHSYFSDIAVGVISGLGCQGYELALAAACEYLDKGATNYCTFILGIE